MFCEEFAQQLPEKQKPRGGRTSEYGDIVPRPFSHHHRNCLRAKLARNWHKLNIDNNDNSVPMYNSLKKKCHTAYICTATRSIDGDLHFSTSVVVIIVVVKSLVSSSSTCPCRWYYYYYYLNPSCVVFSLFFWVVYRRWRYIGHRHRSWYGWLFGGKKTI